MVWRTIGAGESDVAERVDAAVASAGGGARVSYLAASPYVVVALDVDDPAAADALRAEVDAALTTRSSTLRELSVPPLFSYEADRGQSEWSALLGLVHYRSTAAAWRFRLLWVIAIRSGDADELQEPGA